MRWEGNTGLDGLGEARRRLLESDLKMSIQYYISLISIVIRGRGRRRVERKGERKGGKRLDAFRCFVSRFAALSLSPSLSLCVQYLSLYLLANIDPLYRLSRRSLRPCLASSSLRPATRRDLYSPSSFSHSSVPASLHLLLLPLSKLAPRTRFLSLFASCRLNASFSPSVSPLFPSIPPRFSLFPSCTLSSPDPLLQISQNFTKHISISDLLQFSPRAQNSEAQTSSSLGSFPSLPSLSHRRNP